MDGGLLIGPIITVVRQNQRATDGGPPVRHHECPTIHLDAPVAPPRLERPLGAPRSGSRVCQARRKRPSFPVGVRRRASSETPHMERVTLRFRSRKRQPCAGGAGRSTVVALPPLNRPWRVGQRRVCLCRAEDLAWPVAVIAHPGPAAHPRPSLPPRRGAAENPPVPGVGRGRPRRGTPRGSGNPSRQPSSVDPSPGRPRRPPSLPGCPSRRARPGSPAWHGRRPIRTTVRRSATAQRTRVVTRCQAVFRRFPGVTDLGVRLSGQSPRDARPSPRNWTGRVPRPSVQRSA